MPSNTTDINPREKFHHMSDTPLTVNVAPGFEPVVDVFKANFDAGEELGAAFAAYVGDELVVDIYGGWKDRKKSVPWQENTIVPVYSTTKPIAALIAAMLVDQGKLDYETPVAEYWPEFAAASKERLTVGEALSHQGGLPGFVEPIDPALWLDPPALSAALAEQAPMWRPGDGSGYHPLSWGYLIGELVRRVSGRSLGTILREDVCMPLGIDFQIGTPASDHDRAADIKRPTALPELGELNGWKQAAFLTKWAAPDRGGAIWREAEIPSANGHGTATSTARLYGAYANKGRIGTQQLFSEETWYKLTNERCRGQDRVLPFEITFAAGVMRNDQFVYGPNPGTLGHSGWGGSLGFGDPNSGASGAYVMNRQSNILQGDPRAVRLVNALYECL